MPCRELQYGKLLPGGKTGKFVTLPHAHTPLHIRVPRWINEGSDIPLSYFYLREGVLSEKDWDAEKTWDPEL